MRPRWDIDEVGHGVGSARELVADLDRLRPHLLEDDWVAEEPEHHLLPHVRRLCEDRGWKLSWELADHVLELDLVVPDGEWWRERRVAAFSVAGVVSEKVTVMVDEQMNDDETVRFTLVTGMREGDGVFAPHGHVVRVCVRRRGAV